MALFAAAAGTSSTPLSTCRPPRHSFPRPPALLLLTTRPRRLSLRASATASGSIAPAISLTEKALNHLSKMRAEKKQDLCLRIGVKQGGCSGMSYTMELQDRSMAGPDDSVIDYNGFSIVCDPKSLLFVFGMQLDYSDALIGGGFSFQNPNATKTCGCGKSFATNPADESKASECNN